MAEIVSRQAALVAAGTKALGPTMGTGKATWVVLTSPATAAWAQNDTIASPILIPKGSRILSGGFVSREAMGTSVTLDVGLRKASDNSTAIDADGIAAALDVSAAGVSLLNTGALVAAGKEYVTTEDSYLYATLGGANPTDDKQIRIEVPFLFP